MTPATSTAAISEPAFACPLCDAGSRRALLVAGYWIRQCDGCGHQFAEIVIDEAHVRSVYGDAYFRCGGDGYADYLAEGPLLIDRGRRYARLLGRHRSPGSVLDVGAAAGFTLRGFATAGWRPAGVEPNATMARYAREQVGMPVANASFESWTPDQPYDLVTMFQVLPHLGDPRRALDLARAALVDDGLLLIETWDRCSLTARLLGKQWHEYSPPSVLHWFTKAGLIRLAEAVGLRTVASGRLAKWIRASHAKSLLQSKSARSPISRWMLAATRWIPDGAALPYPAEDLFWLLLERR